MSSIGSQMAVQDTHEAGTGQEPETNEDQFIEVHIDAVRGERPGMRTVRADQLHAYLGLQRGLASFVGTARAKHGPGVAMDGYRNAHFTLETALAVSVEHRDRGRTSISVHAKKAVRHLRELLGTLPQARIGKGHYERLADRLVERMDLLEAAMAELQAQERALSARAAGETA